MQTCWCVRGEGECIDPGHVYRRLPTTVVLVHDCAALMHPHCRAASADACILSPAERKRLTSSKLRTDNNLQMGQRAVFDLNFDSAFVDEFAHVYTTTF